GNEVMGMTVEVDPEWAEPTPAGAGAAEASDRGSPTLGMAGTAASAERVAASGLTRASVDGDPGDARDRGDQTPLLPGTWR
ncbi:MAG TPA: hypothetical protein VK069_04390, partial [Mycolicibacillus parakoreensis]|nr:hypothetical protein [Mycolicibacillus parakoreensis]